MDINAWLTDLIDGDSIRAATENASLSSSALSKAITRGTLSPQTVIALCRAYDRSPVTGLVEHGYLSAWESEHASIDGALDKATNQQLLDAILRRSDPEATYLFGMGDDQINPHADVLDLPRRSDATPAIRAVVDDDDPLAGIDPQQYAAHPRTEPLEEDNPTP